MTDFLIKWVLILLLVFTPIAFGSQVLWAYSLMELGILLIIILWGMKGFVSSYTNPAADIQNSQASNLAPQSSIRLPILLLCLFLAIVLLQMIPLPAGIVKIISPKTYELRNQLTVISSVTDNQSEMRNPESKMPSSELPNAKSQIQNAKSEIVSSSNLNPQSWFPLTLCPLATKVEFFKWLALTGLFIFLLHWRIPNNWDRVANHLIIAILLVGVFESLYGIFEFFSGHRHILNLDWSSRITSVTGTFVNRNYFAGYLLMVIPLGISLLFSREADQYGRFMGWRHRLSSLHGKTLLLLFGLILMILGLILSASRMGIVSLLISFSLISFLFRRTHRERRISGVPIMIFGLALLWAAWIGLDAVISRFFTATESLKLRWVFWVNTFRILWDFPFLGCGLGTFMEVFPLYRSFHIVGLATHAENDYLQLASEVGLIGAGLLFFLFLFLFLKAASGIRALPPGEPKRYIGIGGLVGILALMFHSIVERNIQVPANAFLYTVIWAMILRITAASNGKGITREQARGK